MEVFNELHPAVQKAIYDLGWKDFRPIQEQAAESLLTNPSDMLICSPTASGKTEAAFLPILSKVANDPRDGVKILYISPLKALINDQFLRVEQLCTYMEFPITKWHGEASYHKKEKLYDDPKGIMLITPESIEALFQNRSEYLKSMFENLKYIVIDEIHSFIGSCRGNHLISLIRRLERFVCIEPFKIGLSATLSNPLEVAAWLNPKNSEGVKIISDNTVSKKRKGIIRFFADNKVIRNDLEISSTAKGIVSKLGTSGKNLIFANSKFALEKVCNGVKNVVSLTNVPDNYYNHHASLTKSDREFVEAKLRTENDITVFCTSTLELGIDIGSIDRVAFLECPSTVSSFVQRLGRCGRREGSYQEFQFFLTDNSKAPSLINQLHINLIQSIAVVELAKEGWCEPLDTMNFDYSTYVQQILSYLGQTGGAGIGDIYKNISQSSYNGYFSKEETLEILKSLKRHEIVEQDMTGVKKTVYLSEKGERLVDFYDFYAAFKTDPEFSIVNMEADKTIGSLVSELAAKIHINDVFVLNGKRWKAFKIIRKSRTIMVYPTDTNANIELRNSSSGHVIHPRVMKKMEDIYERRIEPKYLDEMAQHMFEEAIFNYDLNFRCDGRSFLDLKDEDYASVTGVPFFAGTKIQNTIWLILCSLDVDMGLFQNTGFGITYLPGLDNLYMLLKDIDFDKITLSDLLRDYDPEELMKDKYDYLLPISILQKSYAQRYLDLPNTVEFLKNLVVFLRRRIGDFEI